MAALGVVEHLDVIEDIGTGTLPGKVNLATNPLALERLEEVFGHRVVMAVDKSAHAADPVVIPKEILGSLVAMLEKHYSKITTTMARIGWRDIKSKIGIKRMTMPNLRPTAFVILSTNHGTMLVNRNDYRLVGDGGYGVGYQLLNTSSFDQNEVDIAKQILMTRKQNFGEGVFAIDCGANIGIHTIEWAKLMYGWGEVIAIEAQERIYYALAGNIAINNCFNARAIWAAVGDKTGTISVPVPDYFRPSSFGSLEIKNKETTEFIGQDIDYSITQQTSLIAIDDLNLSRLDFMKIDIEGMEVEALIGARKSIQKFLPQMMIERIKSNEKDIYNFLLTYEYKIIPMGINILAIHKSDPASNQLIFS
jgi:FkbM family methyltransferase